MCVLIVYYAYDFMLIIVIIIILISVGEDKLPVYFTSWKKG